MWEHTLTKMKKSRVLAPVHIAGGEKQYAYIRMNEKN